MSRATEKVFRELFDFLDGVDPEDEQALEQKINEFQKQYNQKIKDRVEDFEPTALDEAYDLLERAENADRISDARRLAKRAFEKSDECLDAKIFLADIAPNVIEAEKIINQALDYEEKRLRKAGFFDSENIGRFYLIFETRQYIRALHAKAMILFNSGRLRQAIEVCQEILRLNQNDNLGIRYYLMAIYALLEDEMSAAALYEKYPEDDFFMAFTLFLLNYKLGRLKQADKNLRKAIELNGEIVAYYRAAHPPARFFQDTDGYYEPHSTTEIIAYMDMFESLMYTVPTIRTYIHNFLKTKKTKKN